MIPKTIHICHRDIHYLNKVTGPRWKYLNPEYEIKLYDNDMCEEFLLQEFSAVERDIFRFISSGVYKSDFWRVCILYKYGGIYVDADINPLVPLNTFIDSDDDFATCVSHFDNGFNPHFIMCKKEHPDLKRCIDEFVSFYFYVQKMNKPEIRLSVCHVFEKIFKKIFDQGIQKDGKYVIDNETIKIIKEQYVKKEKYRGYKFCTYKNKIVLENKANYYPKHFNNT